jgi:thioredoxin 2
MTADRRGSDAESGPAAAAGRPQSGRPQTDAGRPQAGAGPRSILVCPNCGARNTIRPNPRGSPHCGTCGKPLPWVVDATDATFDVEARTTATVIVDLWAPWCGPCRFVSPILEELAREHAGRLKVIKVNVDENPTLSQRFGAMSIPTLVVWKDGREVDRIVGAAPKPALAARIGPHLAPAA